MVFKIKLSKGTKNLLDRRTKKGLIPQVRKDFNKKGPVKVKQAIVQDMIKGISPVKGKGKWGKYSDSYKEEIDTNTSKKMRDASPTKSKTPVNLRLTGKLHRSLKVFSAGGFLRKYRLVVEFNNFLADIHNRRGAGKSKKVRRLLPTESGEFFNKRVTDVLINELKKSADRIAKIFSRQ